MPDSAKVNFLLVVALLVAVMFLPFFVKWLLGSKPTEKPSAYDEAEIDLVTKVFPDETDLHDAMRNGDIDFVEDHIKELYEQMLMDFDPGYALTLLESRQIDELKDLLGRLAAAQAAYTDLRSE